MSFHTYDVALEMVRVVRGPLEKLASKDPVVADQLRRAAVSVPLNVTEGASRTGRDRTHMYKIAAGSAAEIVAALEVAEAWGQLTAEEIKPTVQLCDRLKAMLWRLTHK